MWLALLHRAMAPARLPPLLERRALSPKRRRSLGFTVIELMVVVTVMGTLSLMAVNRTQTTVEQAKVARAIGDIRAISAEVQGYQVAGQTLPTTLADIDRAGMLDPWGHPYVYVNFALSGTPRTDVFGVALNSEFDVYSLGPDGSSALSLASGVSQDDVVRAADGGFIGKGARY
jgi:general secretion pathway protein G